MNIASLEPRQGVDAGISVAIDGAWLVGSAESGAQVAAFAMIRELARRPQIARVTLVSETGAVPASLQHVANVGGARWTEVLANRKSSFDILHRPYQPGIDVDYRRYRRAADCVVLTVLDLIAYDNPRYHESPWAWRRYQQAFDENVCLADGVFAISGEVATLLEQRFGDRIAGRVRPALLGTDHLYWPDTTAAGTEPGPTIQALGQTPFLLVLGNDFAHKNRDFAVKVFAELRERGYGGRLVLAGFHLDLGSSFDYELSDAGRHRDHIVRLGSVPPAAKVWLLREADAVLYPTSAEGFGLVPFEAAALGTPTAFVKFGPFLETMPAVDACDTWRVDQFADLVQRLLSDPEVQVSQIRSAATALTWSAHVDHILAGYQQLMDPAAPWRSMRRALPGWRTRLARATDAYAYRALNKMRRLTGRTS